MSDDEDVRVLADDALRGWGATDEEIGRARETGLIGPLAMSLAALPGEARFTSAELAEEVGVRPASAARFWRALGFPDVDDEERVFTKEDVDALATVRAMIELGVTDVEIALQMTRVIGSSMARVAEAMLNTGAATRPEAGELLAANLERGLETQGRLLEYVWRRHLQAASRRRLMGEAVSAGQSPNVPLAVGFADLVGFTALSQQVDEATLADVVGRFETLAFDQVTMHGGRVAKMIGDEVMFVVDDVEAALATALALAEAYADDEVLSDVRVGLASGPVLAREGDYYGPVVNLASRIVNIAVPGSVVVSESVYDALAGDARYVFRSMRPRNLKDIGRIRLWRVRRGHPSIG